MWGDEGVTGISSPPAAKGGRPSRTLLGMHVVSALFFSLFFLPFSIQTFPTSGINICDRCVNKVFECVNSFKERLTRSCFFIVFLIFCFPVWEFMSDIIEISCLLHLNSDLVGSFSTSASLGTVFSAPERLRPWCY